MAEKKTRKRDRGQAAFPVVGIGSSAGGVEALQAFFDHMPSDSGMAFIAVPHLDPTRKSRMVEVLEPRTGMKVTTARDGQLIKPDTVYVITPDRYLTVLDGKIRLSKPQDERGHRRPIDMFFHSLGRDLQERAIAVILSGTGTNGASGLRTVKSEGGFVLAQDPQTAGYPDMPQAAIRTGLVDEVLAPKDIPRALMRFASKSYMESPNSEGIGSQERTVAQLLSLLLARTRHDFRSYKKNTIQRRIHRRMSLKGFTELDAYVDAVRGDEEEAKALALDFMITVTGFFRDPAAWKVLEEDVIAPLVKNREPDMPIRVWVPGCATGEEAYSIGMLLLEQMDKAGKQLDVKIFSTDTTTEGLEFARNGLYPTSVVADVPEDRRARYFETEEDACRVSPKLRDLVIFAPQNVLQDPPFSRVDLVSCRNLLIYIEPDIQQKLLRLFHFSLREGGHLFLGTAESITGQEGLFKTVSKKWRIYRRSGMPQGGYAEFPLVGQGHNRPDAVHYSDFQPRRRLTDMARDALLTQFAPAAVVIDSAFRIFYFHGETEPFLRQPPGEPTDDLLTLARDGLRAKVRAAVHAAIKNGEPSSTTVRMRQGENGGDVRVAVRPLQGVQGDDGLLTVTFEEVDASAARAAVRQPRVIETGENGENLEKENKILRTELRVTIEQMESSNEELKASNEEILSMNEELQSSNEELETSKEELQSFNEELNTVNAQLQTKIDELEETTNDLNNLLNSTDIATLFLDRERRIRRFTPAMRELMELIPSDIGRPIGNLSHRFEDGDVAGDAGEILKSLVPISREVRAESGNWYLRRTLPYRTRDDRIDGVVITFSDISQAKTLEQQLREQRDYAESVVETVRQPLLVLRSDLVVEMANDAFYRTFRQVREGTIGRKIYELGNGQWNIPALREALEQVLPNDDAFEDIEVSHDFPEIGERTMLVNGRQLDSVQLILLAIEDITESKRAIENLRASQKRLQDVLETEAVGVLFFSEAGVLVDANDAFLLMTGYSREQVERGELTWRTMTPPEWVELSEERLKIMEETGRIGPYEKEYLLKDGERSWMLFAGRELEDGTLVEFCIDIGDRKRAEETRELLAQEMNHRVKNSLMTVQAVATQTARASSSIDQFRQSFAARLAALAAGHDLLMKTNWQPARLDDLIENAFRPYRSRGRKRYKIGCGDQRVLPQAALAFDLILHELTTNSAKYGALSIAKGLVEITCDMQDDDKKPQRLVWRETGGPKISEPPTKIGFGSRLIERSAAHDLDGAAELEFRPEGLFCTIEFSSQHLENGTS